MKPASPEHLSARDLLHAGFKTDRLDNCWNILESTGLVRQTKIGL